MKNERKRSKTDKNEHENGKCQKPEPGKQNDQGKLKFSLEVPRDSECSNMSPWSKFGEIGNISPSAFRILAKVVP